MSVDVQKLVDGVHDYIGRALSPIVARIKALEERQLQRGEKGDPGESIKGERGADGKDADPAAVAALLKADVEHVVSGIVTAEVARAMLNVPKPKDGERGADGAAGRDGKDGERGADGKSVTAEDVRPFVDAAFSTWALEFERRAHETLQRVVDRMPPPQKGEDGKSLSVEDVRPMVESAVEKAVAAIPKPADGKDADEGAIADDVFERLVGHLPVPKDGRDGKDYDPEVMRAEIQRAVEALPRPKDGEHGKDADPAVIRAEVERAVAAIPKPVDGRDGKDADQAMIHAEIQRAVSAIPRPQDGKSVTVEDVMPMFEGQLAKWQLEFERRASDTLTRAIESMPKPKDGRDGVDGKDGFGFEEIYLEHDGEREAKIVFERGDRRKEFPFKTPALIDRGIYKPENKYLRGDGVTYGGSFFIAQCDYPKTKPGEAGDWRLAVKRGRDGKDG